MYDSMGMLCVLLMLCVEYKYMMLLRMLGRCQKSIVGLALYFLVAREGSVCIM